MALPESRGVGELIMDCVVFEVKFSTSKYLVDFCIES